MSEHARDAAIRFAAIATYGLAALFVVHPVADLLSNFIPLEPGSVQWRYAFVGLLSNYVLTMLAGAVFAFVAAALAGHYRTMRWLSGAAGLLGLALLAATVVFSLDVLQLRISVPAEERFLFKVGAVKSTGKLLLAVVYIGFVAVAGWIASGRGAGKNVGRREAPPLVRT
jgi:hypothetical protein